MRSSNVFLIEHGSKGISSGATQMVVERPFSSAVIGNAFKRGDAK
jgi:hypothetical protein